MALVNVDPEFRRRGPHRRGDLTPEFGGARRVNETHPDIAAPGRWRGAGESCGNEKAA